VILPGQQGVEVLLANYHAPQEACIENSLRALQRHQVRSVRLQRETFDAGLYFRLLAVARIGDLQRMTPFRSAANDARTAQLLTYPVLMAHDVAGYDEVLVGIDQQQHLEYARKLLRAYNRAYDASLAIPRATVVVGRVKDLRQPERKMSKSAPEGCLFLDDAPEDIRKKLRKAVANEEGLENLTFLYRAFVGEGVPASNEELKAHLAEALIARFC
jgi:tryptophanyl-tRNA synthetase